MAAAAITLLRSCRAGRQPSVTANVSSRHWGPEWLRHAAGRLALVPTTTPPLAHRACVVARSHVQRRNANASVWLAGACAHTPASPDLRALRSHVHASQQPCTRGRPPPFSPATRRHAAGLHTRTGRAHHSLGATDARKPPSAACQAATKPASAAAPPASHLTVVVAWRLSVATTISTRNRPPLAAACA